MNKQNIISAAIALVISGSITYQDACTKCAEIEREGVSEENYELAVMKECVELFDAEQSAIKDLEEKA